MTETVPVYACTRLSSRVYEWYAAEVTYVDGEIVDERIVGGPYTGRWVEGCPYWPLDRDDE